MTVKLLSSSGLSKEGKSVGLFMGSHNSQVVTAVTENNGIWGWAIDWNGQIVHLVFFPFFWFFFKHWQWSMTLLNFRDAGIRVFFPLVNIMHFKFYWEIILFFGREVLELQEAIRIKDAEGEAYIAEIEVKATYMLFNLVFMHFMLSRISIRLCTDNWSSIWRYAGSESASSPTGCW